MTRLYLVETEDLCVQNFLDLVEAQALSERLAAVEPNLREYGDRWSAMWLRWPNLGELSDWYYLVYISDDGVHRSTPFTVRCLTLAELGEPSDDSR